MKQVNLVLKLVRSFKLGRNIAIHYKVENTMDLQCFLSCCNLAPCNNLKMINAYMWRLYGFYTPKVGDTHIWILQFVNPIVKPLYYRSTTQVETLSRFNQYSLMFHTLLT